MYYLYSTNDRPGAKLIRWGGRHKCSHFAKFYPKKGVIVESILESGVREISFKDWLKANRIVYAQRMNFNLHEDLLYDLDQTIIGKKYDIKAVLFQSVMTIFKKIFSHTPYGENKWGAKDEYFCLEIILTHRDVLSAHYFDIDFDIENMYPEEFRDIIRNHSFSDELNSDQIKELCRDYA